jgi:hypothetical protein
MGNIELEKIYAAASLVEPKDFTAGNARFEAFVRVATPNAVCRMIEEIKNLRRKLDGLDK